MNLVRKQDEYKLELYDEDIKLVEVKFIADELVWIVYTNEPIIINKEVDLFLYDNLEKLMSNHYLFFSNLSSKSESEIIWFSDGYCDLSNEEETDTINRLVIKKDEDNYIIRVTNPYFIKSNITRVYNVVSFSPLGNGIWSQNIDTGMTFQDDMVTLYQNTFYKQKEKKCKQNVLIKRN